MPVTIVVLYSNFANFLQRFCLSSLSFSWGLSFLVLEVFFQTVQKSLLRMRQNESESGRELFLTRASQRQKAQKQNMVDLHLVEYSEQLHSFQISHHSFITIFNVFNAFSIKHWTSYIFLAIYFEWRQFLDPSLLCKSCELDFFVEPGCVSH